ncbi:MAG TPA: hypothetical protein VK202_03140 [Bacteroidia bacterium]|nr:hypothetical protein [Bacteroidia bacterium]
MSFFINIHLFLILSNCSINANNQKRISFQKAYLGMPFVEFNRAFPNNKLSKISDFEKVLDRDIASCDFYKANSITKSKNRFTLGAYFYKQKLVKFSVKYIDIVSYDIVLRQLENKYGKAKVISNTIEKREYVIEDVDFSITFTDYTQRKIGISTERLSLTFLDKRIYSQIRKDEKKGHQELIE